MWKRTFPNLSSAADRKERGAAAVEFALVFPLVIMLLITVIEFSRLWNIQATLSDAARISARYVAVHSSDPLGGDIVSEAKDEVRQIPGFVDWDAATINISDCIDDVVVSTVSVSPGSVTAWFSSVLGTPITMSATGRMPCGG